MDNVQPGIDYFKELAKAGRLDTGDTTSARLASGEMVCCVGNYDYSVLAWRDNIIAENPSMELDITIPSDGSVTNGYARSSTNMLLIQTQPVLPSNISVVMKVPSTVQKAMPAQLNRM